ncbi:MAG: ribonuclease T [Oceanospirillaceae bacterium]|jgi:ribonuclease T|uniref:ribonuclease T n=1 Tax=Thalassolituus sp. TaxID=2030822 RepID=UPI000C41156B|nr:ribonuclease T [Thalassolituus sp.]MAE34719.1 ribonuclease T [Oceanospirillaceae bacterium]MAE35765.1 ribonuclease T [Oceanospirillaceae bacterium]MDQ4423274.1 ribonuclease T [Thalassolituus sp.]MDQ4427380.1 ribonuclease T [Thalassolituus sp.]|tara:strand:- start:7512 stop:8159 length:648 start_codon:yes stop_codon:yes gene_type:complete
MTIEEKQEKSLMAQRFRGFLPVVVDVETGGFNADSDALLEIAMVTLKMDDDGYLHPDETLSANIHPFDGANLEQEALDFTGIDPFDPERDAEFEIDALTPMLQTVRREIKHYGCNRAVLVGHNAHFDHGFLRAAIDRNDIKRDPFHPFSSFDTASIAAIALGQTVLAKSCKVAGIEFDNNEAHSAAYDTFKTAELFCYIVNRYKDLGGWPLAAED